MKVYYVSTIFRDVKIAIRFLKHFRKNFPKKNSELYLYCHDSNSYSESIKYDCENINIIKGNENVFYTEAINIGISFILKKAKNGNICILDSDCFVSENFHDICLKNKSRGLIFRNIDFKTKEILPAGFLIKNKILGGSLNIEEKIISIQKKYYKIQYSNGRGLTFPIDFVRKNGLLNYIDFPLYGSDNDYSWRISKSIGLYYCIATEIFSNKFETNLNPLVVRMSFKQRIKSLYSIKSSINIFVRYKLLNSICPNKFYKPLWIIRGITVCLLIAFLPFKLKNKLSKFK